MFSPFSHFLSYGSTDQQTIREFAGRYDGIIVPGTIAAFQAEGTRGFVLSLSAAQRTPYAIDSRFPLFQSVVDEPKKSHLALARVLGVIDEVDSHHMVRSEFWNEDTIAHVARNWLDFNTAYLDLQPKAFEKYARRLKKSLPQTNAQGPSWILPPYLTVGPAYPGAAAVSGGLWEASKSLETDLGAPGALRRVMAVQSASDLYGYVASADLNEVIIWVSNLDEQSPSSAPQLTAYVEQVAQIGRDGIAPFALYGGYFAVMLRAVGLRGASHGVGFSEHRNHIELKSSGAAPARYYVQRAHKYFPIDLASELWRRDRSLVESYYPGFAGIDPQELDYHELMMHSVEARRDEILRSTDWSISDHVVDLVRTQAAYRADLSAIRLTTGLQTRVASNLFHLSMWETVLNSAVI